MKKEVFFGILLLFFTLLSTKSLAQKAILGSEKSGNCSYYASKFNGNRTYFGEIYQPEEYTAAHKTLPYNTVLAVTEPISGHTVYVRVTDRGPHTHNRLLDISFAAAKQLNLENKGVAKVTVKVVGFDGIKILNAQDPNAEDAEIKNEQQ